MNEELVRVGAECREGIKKEKGLIDGWMQVQKMND